MRPPARRAVVGTGIFAGWKMVAIAFFSCFVSVGFSFYCYGVFFKAIMADLGGSRFAVSTGMTAMNLGVAAASPFVGRVLDRGGAKRVMCGGAVMLALGFTLASRVTRLWQFHVVFGTLIGVSVCMLGPLATSALVANWFVAQRGKALAYATMGISAAGVVIPVCMTKIIAAHGWRFAFALCATLAALVLLPVLYHGVIGRPEDVGATADGATPAQDPPRANRRTPQPPPFQIWEAVRTRNFIGITVVIALNSCCMQGVTTHLVPFLTDCGWTGSNAALSLSLVALAALMGRPLFGLVVDRLPLRSVVVGAVVLQALGLSALANGTDAWSILPGLVVFALGMGCLMPLQGALIGAAFGRQAFGRVMGAMSPAMFPIINVGVPLAGWLHDANGDYHLAFKIFLAFYVLSVAFVGVLRLPSPAAVRG